MFRTILCFSTFAVATLLAAAQENRPRLSAAQQQQLFHKNREMIKTLVDSSLDISKQPGDYIQRSLAYGISAVLMSIVFGWLASVAFRQRT